MEDYIVGHTVERKTGEDGTEVETYRMQFYSGKIIYQDRWMEYGWDGEPISRVSLFYSLEEGGGDE